MLDELHTICRKLLREGTVQVVIGYGQGPDGVKAHPVFITEAGQVAQLIWNSACHHNLVTYLSRPHIRALGKPAVVVKTCDERALVILQRESQLRREEIYVIGMTCDDQHVPSRQTCRDCVSRSPRFADVVVGKGTAEGEEGSRQSDRFAELDRFLQKSPEQRMQYWQEAFQRCTRCYACRQVCPLCYCPRCIADKNQPVCFDTSPTLKGNFAWHITRAFHLAGRCVGCDACTRACPAGIDLRLLNLSLARPVEEQFGYRAGEELEMEPVIGSYSEQDPESFIR
ncbi:MAG: hypothetical protein ACYC6N_14255 [Pirellulaceae bacterium]